MSLMTIIELMLGLILNMNITIHPSGILKQQELLKVDIMFLVKKLHQLFQITTIELMLGLIHNGKRRILPNGLQKLQKLLKVDIMLLLKKDKKFILHKLQQFLITTIE